MGYGAHYVWPQKGMKIRLRRTFRIGCGRTCNFLFCNEMGGAIFQPPTHGTSIFFEIRHSTNPLLKTNDLSIHTPVWENT